MTEKISPIVFPPEENIIYKLVIREKKINGVAITIFSLVILKLSLIVLNMPFSPKLIYNHIIIYTNYNTVAIYLTFKILFISYLGEVVSYIPNSVFKVSEMPEFITA